LILQRDVATSPGRYRYDFRCTIGDKDADHDDDVVYQMPYAQGKSYRVLQGYGSRFSHTGREAHTVDFNMREGTPVHAARGGVVARTVESHSVGCWDDGCGRYANYIIIVHSDNTTGEYYHLQKDGALVEPGEIVETGQLIGLSGNTGHTTMPHLHFGVYRAIAWGREQSIPVRFMTADGILDKPRRGGHYLATGPRDRTLTRGN
jgi:murein DD-endopeptidase MepM/ murein hydrolase activator NlpD